MAVAAVAAAVDDRILRLPRHVDLTGAHSLGILPSTVDSRSCLLRGATVPDVEDQSADLTCTEFFVI